MVAGWGGGRVQQRRPLALLATDGVDGEHDMLSIHMRLEQRPLGAVRCGLLLRATPSPSELLS